VAAVAGERVVSVSDDSAVAAVGLRGLVTVQAAERLEDATDMAIRAVGVMRSGGDGKAVIE